MKPSRANMEAGTGDLHPRAELRGLIGHLRGRVLLLVAIFGVGFVGGYPLAGRVIEMLLDSSSYRPDDVEVIILHPMEAVLLRLRIGVQIGAIMSGFFLICDLSWNGRKIFAGAKRSEIKGANRFGGFILVLISALALACIGAIYSHEVLVPLLLEYLSEDASSANLSSTWQLQSWVGFVSGLYFASIFGFQVPVVILLLLRYGVVSNDGIKRNRGVLWFLGMSFGAFLSPPDPLSMFLVAGPILVLIELALILDSLTRNQ